MAIAMAIANYFRNGGSTILARLPRLERYGAVRTFCFLCVCPFQLCRVGTEGPSCVWARAFAHLGLLTAVHALRPLPATLADQR